MAGDWIKIENVTPAKPEIDVIAELLEVSVNEVLGGLVRVWIWADQQTIDGNARGVTKNAIDRNSGVTGLANAMLDSRVRWLIENENGGFLFPNFERHNGQTAKTRALTSKRVSDLRKRSCNAGIVTQSLPEKRREEIYKNSPNPSLASKEVTGCVCEISEEDQDDQPDHFDTIWAAWPAHRRKDRGRAERAWRKLDEGAVTRAEICQAALAYAQSPLGQSAACKRLQAWLAAKCWLDAPEAWQNVPFADQARASPDPAGGKIHMDETLKAEMERAKEIRNQRTRRAARA